MIMKAISFKWMVVKKVVIFFVQVAYNINIAENGCST